MTRGTKALIVALAGIIALGTMAAALGPIVYRGLVVPLGESRAVRPTVLSDASAGVPATRPSRTGTWNVVSQSWAGYRLGGMHDDDGDEIVGRTPRVTGSIRIADGAITDAVIRVDLASMTTGDARSDRKFRQVAPSASEETVELVVTDAHADAAFGSVGTVHLTGELSLSGTTRTVRLDLQTQLTPDGGIVVGHIVVDPADFATESSTLPLSVDQASLEFSLTLRRQ